MVCTSASMLVDSIMDDEFSLAEQRIHERNFMVIGNHMVGDISVRNKDGVKKRVCERNVV